jgi:hypothetical protein
MRDAGDQQDMINYADKSKDAYKINWWKHLNS